MRDICDQVSARETLNLLGEFGFGKLLDTLENDPTVYSKGRPVLKRVADRLGIDPERCEALLIEAQKLIEGEIEWPQNTWMPPNSPAYSASPSAGCSGATTRTAARLPLACT
jgi:hypothetical protein